MNCPILLKSIDAITSLSSRKSVLGISPTAGVSSLNTAVTIVARMIAISDDGQYWFIFFGNKKMKTITASPTRNVVMSKC